MSAAAAIMMPGDYAVIGWWGKKTHKIRQESAFRTRCRPDCISNFCMFTIAIQYNVLLKFNTGRFASHE